MAWQGIEGHDAIVERFRHSLSSGRLGSTFLFVGPAGIGKRTFASKLAQSLLCTSSAEEALDPCGTCAACRQVLAESHPDLELVRKPAGKSFIPIELLIGDKGHRMREGLCARIAMKPSAGGRRVAMIDDADDLNQEGANCLLKTLEEPPPRSVLILIGTSLQRQLPTIRSRCQLVNFRRLDDDVLGKLILSTGISSDPQAAACLASVSGGSLATAAALSDPSWAEFRLSLYEFLATTDWIASQQARVISQFVDEAGKEAGPRRQRLRLAIELVTEFYRQTLRACIGSQPTGDQPMIAAAGQLAAVWPR